MQQSGHGRASRRPEAANPNVAALLEAAARARPDDPALLRADGTAAWSLRGLADLVGARAARLAERGIGPGDTVLVLAGGHGAVSVAAAVLWSGAAILVPPRGVGPRAAVVAALELRPRAVVASPALWSLSLLAPELLRVPVRFVTGARGFPGVASLDGSAATRGAGRDPSRTPPFPAGPDDPAAVTFTTGTTGVPQPVVRSHAVLRGQHDALERLRPTRTGDVDLAGLPMLVLHDLARGVPVVLGRSRGAALAATVRGLGVTTAGGFPPLFEDLVRHAPPGGYPALRAVHVGGAPVTPELVRRVGSVAPGATLTVVYGATEAEPIGALDGAAYLALNEAREPGDGICVGLPVAGLQVRLGGHEWTEGAGATVAGRLEVRGSQVVAAAGGEGGWRDTGDLARVDREGRIWLLGRASAAVDGVPPLVIEQAAEAIAGVAAAALLPAGTGRPRPTLALAVDTGERGAVPRIARRVIQERWPGLDVVGLPALPRERRSGKIDLRRLARLVAA